MPQEVLLLARTTTLQKPKTPSPWRVRCLLSDCTLDLTLVCGAVRVLESLSQKEAHLKPGAMKCFDGLLLQHVVPLVDVSLLDTSLVVAKTITKAKKQKHVDVRSRILWNIVRQWVSITRCVSF